MFIKCLFKLIFITSLACSCCQTFAKEIHIGIQHEYPPYIFTEDGNITGITIELAEAAFALLGISAHYTQYPFQRMLASAKSGQVDAVMLVFKTPDRENYLYYPSQPLYFEQNAFFTLKSSHINYSGHLQDFQDHTIGVVAGFSYGKAFDQATFLHKDYSINDEMLLKKLLANRFTIGVGNHYVLSFFAKKLGALTQIQFLEPNLFDQNPLYIGFSKGIPDNVKLATQFSNALEEIKKSGQYQRIIDKYLP